MLTGSLFTGSFYFGCVVGFLAGMAFAIARRAWRDYLTVKNSVPGMRKKAWSDIRVAFGWMVALVVLGLIAFAMVVDSDGPPTEPAGVPSVRTS